MKNEKFLDHLQKIQRSHEQRVKDDVAVLGSNAYLFKFLVL